ncbi:MAG: hypothetical protein GTN45_04940, partial [Xanthomonadales bacterium]|nr:hypothetical protein [Xanthomonadales bacterium]
CDYGRGTFRRYREAERIGAPLLRSADGKASPVAWGRALEAVHEKIEQGRGGA